MLARADTLRPAEELSVSKCLRCGAGSEWLQGHVPVEGTEMGLFSKSGKVQYLCGKCRSPNIAQFVWGGQQAYACTPCNQWFPWPSRIKHSLGFQSDRSADVP